MTAESSLNDSRATSPGRALRLAAHHFLPPLIGGGLALSLARAWQLPIASTGIAACVLGIYAAYALDDLVDTPPGTRLRFRGLLVAATVVSSFGVGLLAVLDRSILVSVVALGALGLFYVPLKRAIPKNLLVAGAWTGAVVLLPFDEPPALVTSWRLVAALFLAILANTTLCDAPDVVEDRHAGVRGLAPRLGAETAGRIAGGIALLGSGLAVWGGSVPIAAACGFFALCGLGHLRIDRFVLDLALVAPGLLTLAALLSEV